MTDVKFWNGLAENYARKPVENPEAFEKKIALTKTQITPQSVVLDIGCGTGSLVLRLASSAKHIHGLDLSSEMIRIANNKADVADASNVSFHVGPFDDNFSIFDDDSLDGICAFSVLHLVADRPRALSHIYRLLKPGGFFVSSTLCLGESSVPYRPILSVMRWLGKAPSVAIFSKKLLKDELHQAGFVDIEEPDVGAKFTIAFLVAHKPC